VAGVKFSIRHAFLPRPLHFLPARAFRFGSAELRLAISRDFVQNEL